jgi:hypothetical protein
VDASCVGDSFTVVLVVVCVITRGGADTGGGVGIEDVVDVEVVEVVDVVLGVVLGVEVVVGDVVVGLLTVVVGDVVCALGGGVVTGGRVVTVGDLVGGTVITVVNVVLGLSTTVVTTGLTGPKSKPRGPSSSMNCLRAS